MKYSPVEGFSKLSKQEKIDYLISNYLNKEQKYNDILHKYWNLDKNIQVLHDEFSENTLTNFYMPYGIAPNFLIDGELKAIPMVIEESSVVAAASKSAKFWLNKGGFKTTILGEEKIGHTHFTFSGAGKKLQDFFEQTLKKRFFEGTEDITQNMRKRGGGILKIEFIDKTEILPDYYQIKASFNTKDSMGANFINSCLEKFGIILKEEIQNSDKFTLDEKESLCVVMNILSNLTPNCIARAEVSCEVNDLKDESGIHPEEFAHNFKRAINIAEVEPYRATTHNKGIMNGVDAVVIATGNDFRATEACVHAFASRSGVYTSLSHCSVDSGIFKFWIDLPISIGVVGGLTNLHPMVKFSLDLLGNPSASKLMGIIATSGLAQNFAAIRSLITTGIQKGHMKMHLLNILNQFNATDYEKQYFINHFKDKTVSYHEIVSELNKFRKEK